MIKANSFLKRAGQNILSYNDKIDFVMKARDENRLSQLATHDDPEIRDIVASLTQDENTLEQLAGDPDPEIRAKAKTRIVRTIKNQDLLLQFLEDESYQVRYAAAKLIQNKDILKQLVTDESSSVRSLVAERIQDEDILSQLATDENFLVRKAVVQNTQNENILSQLATDKSFNVRQEVARKTKNEKLLEQMELNDRNEGVRFIAKKRLQELHSSPKIANLSKTVNLFYKTVQASYN